MNVGDSALSAFYGSGDMGALRLTLISHRWLALWLIGVTLALKIVVPSGYMVAQQGTVLTVSICGDASATNLVRHIVIPPRETPADVQEKHVKSAPCLFAGLDMAGAVGADPFLLAQALAFIIATGFAPHDETEPTPHTYLRPPLRGPPLLT